MTGPVDVGLIGSDGETIMMDREARRAVRNAIFHHINAEKTKLETLESMAHNFFPLGYYDEGMPISAGALRDLMDMFGVKM